MSIVQLLRSLQLKSNPCIVITVLEKVTQAT